MFAKINVFIRIFLILTVFFTSKMLYSQIEMGGERVEDVAPDKRERKTYEKSGVELFANYHGLQSNRTLESNKFPWGDSLGVRVNEKGDWVNSFSIGVRSSLVQNIYIDMGLGYFTNSTSYLFESTDSTYSRNEVYRHVGVPIKVAYISPGEIGFYLGLGVMPKAFIGQKVKELTETSLFGKQENDFVVKEGFEKVLLDFIGSAGIRADLSDKYGATLLLESRRQLNSNYGDQGPFIRKSFHLGFSFGLQLYL